MKKILLVLGMTVCLAGMSACSGKQPAAAQDAVLDEATAVSLGDMVVDNIAQIVSSGMQEQYADNAVVAAAVASWESALPELGDYQGILDHEVSYDADSTTIEVTVGGSKHNAVVDIEVDEDGYVTGVTTNVVKRLGEMMKDAMLNTVLGMGTVFVVLILIAFIISLFQFIPALQEKFSKKKAAPVPKTAAAPAAPAPVQKQEAPQEDGCELAAVIAAAIAAYEGEAGQAVNPGDLVVRSIKKRSGRWQRA